MAKNILIGQSGGPTAAINASLAGAIMESLGNDEINEIYGARNGIEGVLKRDFIDLKRSIKSKEDLQILKGTPAMALGSCRCKLPDLTSDVYQEILKIFLEYEIGYFLYIGGNDSMDTVKKLSSYFLSLDKDIKVVGIPKTIDNDLCCTDHTPGFGSAAKYIATSVAEIARDSAVYNTKSVTIVEIMGRNAGWLAASSALARLTGCDAPHMIYLSEVVFDTDRFILELKKVLESNKNVVVAVSEGLKLKNGSYVADSELSGMKDAFGHKYLSGIGKYMEDLVRQKIGCKVRSVNLNVLQRCASHLSSATDIKEASEVGASAVRFALSGKTGVVAVIKRISNEPYKVDYQWCEVDKIANFVKCVPEDWIAYNGYDVTTEMMEYLKPLIIGEQTQPLSYGMPKFFSFD
jgi:ATP-dependent phosphofructokinase / diphosphate-dependent phosphofructokinase